MLQFAQYLELAEHVDPCIQDIGSPHFSRWCHRTPHSSSTWSWRWRGLYTLSRIVSRTQCKWHAQVVPADATFEQYLELAVAEDRATEIPIDPLSMNGFKAGKHTAEALEIEGVTAEVRHLALKLC